MIIIGSVFGLMGGFKIANLQYNSEQSRAKNREIAMASKDRPPAATQAEVSAIIEKAKANPNDADAQIQAAFQFIQIDRFQDAMPFLEQAKKADPEDRRVDAGLGLAYFMQGQFDQAIDSLKRSREQGVNDPSVTSLLIGAYINSKKNLDEAERLYKELESQKVPPNTLAQIRADLDAARTGKTVNPTVNQGEAPSEKNGEAMKPRTTLSHGPEQPKITK
jgi:pentatricopeptide repeat protein